MDISITAAHTQELAPKLSSYAAVTEETGPEPTTASGPTLYPHHVWKKWLLNSNNNALNQ